VVMPAAAKSAAVTLSLPTSSLRKSVCN
jgi:hypothetical protein